MHIYFSLACNTGKISNQAIKIVKIFTSYLNLEMYIGKRKFGLEKSSIRIRDSEELLNCLRLCEKLEF